jgi:hypothetical protein
MRRKQLGVSLIGLIVVSAIIIAMLLVAMKLAPSYIEFFAIKKAVNAIASDKTASSSVAEVRKSFDKYATIDDISTIKGSDLEISKEGGSTVIRAQYRREIPLVANVGVYIDFVAEGK